MKKVALFDPYLDTLGGGERHILSIIEVLADAGHEINIFWDKNLSAEIENRFTLKHAGAYKYLPNIFKQGNAIRTFGALSEFDYFFYVTDGSYFASGAKNNFVFAMVPDPDLYRMGIVNRLKLWNYKFISNSPFTTRWLLKWGINPVTIPPYLESNKEKTETEAKQKMILSVARFFPHLHSKNQAEIIRTFKVLKQSVPEFEDYRLVLAGGLKEEDREYFTLLENEAKDDPSIALEPNVSRDRLNELYGKAAFFWHFTGVGVDEKINPEMVEHFGIAPIEAMANGAVVFCHNSGGPKEFITDGENGFLFVDGPDIIKKMAIVEKNSGLKSSIKEKAIDTVRKRYNYEVFKNNVITAI